jgi:alkenylglycerophosphocholine/alkenylglycerophosphoethanolamine hydrolase
METASLIAFVAFAALDWFAVGRSNRRIEYVAKPATLAALIVYAASGVSCSPLLIAALCFGLLGDVYLMLPVDLFVAGLAAFLIGHLAYIAVFEAPLGWRLLWFAVVVAGTFPVARRIISAMKDAKLRFAVVAYLAVISFMAASAIASGLPVAAFGAVLFVVSDALIAWNRFVAPLSWGRVAIIVTYHLGQFGLAHALR